jgi:hypothetical protein
MNKSMSSATTATSFSSSATRSPLWKRIISLFLTFFVNKETTIDMPYTNEEISALHRISAKTEEGCIDAQTWKDLDLNKYSEKLFSEISIFGQQTLHLRLRRGGEKTNLSDNAAMRYRSLLENTELCKLLGMIFEPLRKLNVEASGTVFSNIIFQTPIWAKGLWAFQLFILFVILNSITSLTWLAALFALVFILLAIQARWYTEVEQFERNLATIRVMLEASKDLAAIPNPHANPFLQDTPKDSVALERVRRKITRSFFERAIPGVITYVDWFLLSNIRHHFRSLNIIKDNQLLLQRCYLRIGNLEADLAVARHLSVTPQICWATATASNTISFIDVVNPLLLNAAPLSITIENKGVFLSGQNGAGKSTFLRTLGINLVVGRAFGFCYAASASIPTIPVYSSIQIEDSMDSGESLYMAELRRARELLFSSIGTHKGVYIIDEIFRGTNHVESVSAAAAVIHELTQHALVIVSSHNLVLAAILEKHLTPLRVVSHDTHLGKLSISPGVLDDPNGITLLTTTGFDRNVSTNANAVFSWLSGYLAHPKECPDILEHGEKT